MMRLLEWTTSYFKSRGSDCARLDAEVLLAEARQCERIRLYTMFDDVPNEQERAAFREMVRRRGQGTPVAYLVGHKEFYSMAFRVDENVLIPRAETEHVIIEALDHIKQLPLDERDTPLHIADIGTGSGAIAVTLAKHCPAAIVTAVDLSEDALRIAKWNADKHEVTEQVTFLHGDLMGPVTTPVDVLCSNPPYISEKEYEALDPQVRDHEPRLALLAGDDGKELILRLRDQAAEKVVQGGKVIIELSPMIASACRDDFEAHPAFTDVHLVKDLSRLDRLLIAARA